METKYQPELKSLKMTVKAKYELVNLQIINFVDVELSLDGSVEQSIETKLGVECCRLPRLKPNSTWYLWKCLAFPIRIDHSASTWLENSYLIELRDLNVLYIAE